MGIDDAMAEGEKFELSVRFWRTILEIAAHKWGSVAQSERREKPASWAGIQASAGCRGPLLPGGSWRESDANIQLNTAPFFGRGLERVRDACPPTGRDHVRTFSLKPSVLFSVVSATFSCLVHSIRGASWRSLCKSRGIIVPQPMPELLDHEHQRR